VVGFYRKRAFKSEWTSSNNLVARDCDSGNDRDFIFALGTARTNGDELRGLKPEGEFFVCSWAFFAERLWGHMVLVSLCQMSIVSNMNSRDILLWTASQFGFFNPVNCVRPLNR